MTNFHPRHIATHDAGSAGYTAGRPRGAVAIYDDNRLHLYRASTPERAAFKAWADATFSGMNCAKLRGVWPEYVVRQPG